MKTRVEINRTRPTYTFQFDSDTHIRSELPILRFDFHVAPRNSGTGIGQKAFGRRLTKVNSGSADRVETHIAIEGGPLPACHDGGVIESRATRGALETAAKHWIAQEGLLLRSSHFRVPHLDA